MTRAQLEHAIRAACRILGVDEVILVGSQAILGPHPDAPRELRMSAEVDVWAEGLAENEIDHLNVSGIDSPFHEEHGFYLDPVGPTTALLPPDWRDRAVYVEVTGEAAAAWCPEPTDLAISKLARGESKDTDFVGAMIFHGLTTERGLRERRALLSDLQPGDAHRLDTALRVALSKAAERRRSRRR